MFKIDRNQGPGSPGRRRRAPNSESAVDDVQQLHEEKGKKWFTEMNAVNPKLLPGMQTDVEVSDIIAKRKTDRHDFILLNTTAFGKVLVFDGTIQITQKDCWTYYEMSTHLPLTCHPNPRKVLIVGGLDGSGLAKEILKHESVESVDHVEDDEEMVNLLKKHFHASGFDYDNPKFKYHPVDAKKFLKLHQGEFDVIISDFSVPPPNADGLFGESYFELVKDALKPDGITITLTSGIWVEMRRPTRILTEKIRWLRNLFPSVDYYGFNIPSCASGQGGNIICSVTPEVDFRRPERPLSEDQLADWSLGYYNLDIHAAAFALPQFVKNQLYPTGRHSDFAIYPYQ
ncbi:putative Spermidine synthase [Hypsibius exemplaris]|uniref:Spermidine synthase n=1 Tax=Hypsibius exemplaris TaxID=2072580 RepID=A0A1W0WTC8_HYPEX|nr:putative Spermidine synthase [Hypsibius exemplaris]